MSKLKIYLADLTHTGICIVSENIPLGIALLASYAQRQFKGQIEISLFKYPDKLLSALENDSPDILGVSNYIWNCNLSEWACKKAKQLCPNILTVKGGWNFPLDDRERENFLKKHSATDIYVVNEGELTFAAIVSQYLEFGRDSLLQGPIQGCVYLDYSQSQVRLIKGSEMDRIENLDIIPSPYTSGLLDSFFDGISTPVIETTRGCPYKCNYCNSAVPYYSKVRHFSDKYILKELNYIAEMVSKKGGGPLIIADTNFGMYEKDSKIVKAISRIRKQYEWPNSILLTTGKKKIKNILDMISPIKDILVPSLSVQSMNNNTLEEIGRKNFSRSEYRTLAKYAEQIKITTYAEKIVPLPFETLETYRKGLLNLIQAGAKKIISYTLQMNYGTVYRVRDYHTAHGYSGYYRLIPNAFGMYDKDIVFDIEKVAIATEYLSFKDYIEIRCMTLYLELMYNNCCFKEVIKLLKEKGFSAADYFEAVCAEFDNAPASLKNIKQMFINETESELFYSEEEAIEFYSEKKSLKRLSVGDIGGNVVFKYKAIVYDEHINDLISYVIDCAGKLIQADTNPEHDSILKNLQAYLNYKFIGLFDPDTDNTVLFKSNYDISTWIDDRIKKNISVFKTAITYSFKYTENQINLRTELFNRYDYSIISGKTKIIAKTMVFQNLLRTPFKISDQVEQRAVD